MSAQAVDMLVETGRKGSPQRIENDIEPLAPREFRRRHGDFGHERIAPGFGSLGIGEGTY
jgi:hypothetical protein